MSRKLLLENLEQLDLVTGMPPGFAAHAISGAQYFHAKGAWGILFLQEIQTPMYLFRHFFFSIKNSICFFNEDENNKLQSLLNIKGHFDFEIMGQDKIELKEKVFVLFITAGQTTLTTVHKGNSSLLNAHYAPSLYQDLVPYFTSLKEDLKKAIKNAQYFLCIGTKARDSVHDTIKAIWKEKYISVLQAKQVELRLESCLFTMFAQSYDAAAPANISPEERRFAEESTFSQLILFIVTEHPYHHHDIIISRHPGKCSNVGIFCKHGCSPTFNSVFIMFYKRLRFTQRSYAPKHPQGKVIQYRHLNTESNIKHAAKFELNFKFLRK